MFTCVFFTLFSSKLIKDHKKLRDYNNPKLKYKVNKNIWPNN